MKRSLPLNSTYAITTLHMNWCSLCVFFISPWLIIKFWRLANSSENLKVKSCIYPQSMQGTGKCLCSTASVSLSPDLKGPSQQGWGGGFLFNDSSGAAQISTVMTGSNFSIYPLGTDQDPLKIIQWRSCHERSVAKLAFVCLLNGGKSYVCRLEKSLKCSAHTCTSSLGILHCNYRPNAAILRTCLKSVKEPK